MKKILVIGSGWAGSSFIKHIDTDKYDVTVISLNRNFLYTPLLVNSIFYKKNLLYNIQNINNIKYEYGYVNDIDLKNNSLFIERKKVNYDYLVLANGSEVNTFNIEGVDENCLFLKKEEDIVTIRNKINNLPKSSNIAVIGCGPTGSELIGSLIDLKKFNIYAIDGLKVPLTSFTNSISKYTYNLWGKNNVNLLLGNFVKKIDKNNIYYGKDSVKYDLAFWCGGVKISELSRNINKKLNLECKFGIPVNDYLKVNNTHNVYAIGDCSYNKNPPIAQVAYQEGKYLAYNFNKDLKDVKPFAFVNKGQICYIGNGESVYQNNYFTCKGKLVGYFNNIVHIYNAINFDQMISFIKDKL